MAQYAARDSIDLHCQVMQLYYYVMSRLLSSDVQLCNVQK